MRSGRLRRQSDVHSDDEQEQNSRTRGRSSQGSAGRRPEPAKRRRIAAADSDDDEPDDYQPVMTQIEDDGDRAEDNEISARDGEVSDVMRFIMRKNANNEPCRASDLSKFALAKHKNHLPISRIIEAAAHRFKNDMGYELVLLDAIDSRGEIVSHQRPQEDDNDDDEDQERPAARKKKEKRPSIHKVYILRNAIENQAWIEQINAKDDSFNAYRGLLMAVYGFLYIRKGSTNESDLFDFLSKLGLEGGNKRSLFGDIRNQIVNLTKQQFLHRRKIDGSDDGINVYEYQIGTRGLKLLSKSDIRDFVSAIMGINLPADDLDEE